MKRRSLLLAAASAAPAAALAAPLGEALQRTAAPVRQPERAVLLSLAHAGDRLVAVGERGIVALSDDGGVRWRQSPCPVSVTLTMVRFADARHGVAVGHAGTVLTTANGGENWELKLDGRRVAQLAKAAATTAMARKDAERLEADGPDKPFLDVLAWDARRMLAVGAYGLMVHTDDGGATWSWWAERAPNPKALHWFLARRSGNTVVLAGEQGQIVRSDDAGATFKGLATPYKGSWFTGDLRADGRLLMAGLRGNVWRSADAGATWVQVSSPVASSVTALLATSDREFLLATQAGVLLRLRGDALEALPGQPLPTPSALAHSSGKWLVAGMAGIQVLPASSGVSP